MEGCHIVIFGLLQPGGTESFSSLIPGFGPRSSQKLYDKTIRHEQIDAKFDMLSKHRRWRMGVAGSFWSQWPVYLTAPIVGRDLLSRTYVYLPGGREKSTSRAHPYCNISSAFFFLRFTLSSRPNMISILSSGIAVFQLYALGFRWKEFRTISE